MKIYNRALLKKNLDLAKLLIPLINDSPTILLFFIMTVSMKKVGSL